jgi:hypothetical protein
MKDANGRQVPGLSRLVGFTVACLIMEGLAIYWGAGKGSRGVLSIVLGALLLACMVILWLAAAVTQWRRRNLQPPG